jgi:hypothetical protein
MRILAVTGILVGVLALAAMPAHAASDSLGTDFWLLFTGNLAAPTLTLFITGETATTGTVEAPGFAAPTPFAVTPGVITAVPLQAAAHVTASDVVENLGIHVTALDEVTVYGLNQSPATTDAFLGLPTDILGTDYIVLGYRNGGAVQGSEFGIVATQDDTTVTITPTVTTGVRAAGVPYAIVLDRGQTYQLRNTTSGLDLSGTVITSDKPIAVFGGHFCANIPPEFVFCDHIVEELPPTSTWGKSFLTMPLANRNPNDVPGRGDTFRFLASTNGTNVKVNGVAVVTLGRGQVHELIIDAPARIDADQPILVAQYSNSGSFDGVPNSDPFMMLIPPFEQFLADYTVTTPATFPVAFTNFINVVAPTAAVGAIQLDGVPIPAGSYTPIASGFAGVQIPVPIGTHNLTGPLPFGVFVYGFASADSYGYPGGLSLAPIATVTSVVLSPKTAVNPVGAEHCVIATVTDQNDDPVVGVRVDFTVTGANPTAGFANTDANGQAEFCYTGENAGQDSITASVGSIADEASKTWGGCEDAEGPCLIAGGTANEDYFVGDPPQLSPGLKVNVSVSNVQTIKITKTAQVFADTCRERLGSSRKITWTQEIDASTGEVLTTQEVSALKATAKKLKKMSKAKRRALLAAVLNGVGSFDVKISSLGLETLEVAREHGCEAVRLVTSFTMVGLDELRNERVRLPKVEVSRRFSPP